MHILLYIRISVISLITCIDCRGVGIMIYQLLKINYVDKS